MGDKTQLLALLLAAKWRKPWPIILGILCATLLNHAAAAAVGAWLAALVGPVALRWILGLSFIAMGAWALIPDRMDEDPRVRGNLGVFGATLVLFFLVEIGDKTQLATVALAARYATTVWDSVAVVAGTTAGMMIANVPAVLLGEKLLARIPVKVFRAVAAALFALLGVLILLR
jgi:Ca2+/H+ antiporter, TMEM165/GDT1 family